MIQTFHGGSKRLPRRDKMSKGQVVPIQLSEDSEAKDQARSGAADELVSSTELPVPQQVEAITPVFPAVEHVFPPL